MLKIGYFSKLSRISIRMLRHYDEMDLLKPSQVDRFTGYRYYDAGQLCLANRIHALKSMGFRLTSIIDILRIYSEPEALKTYLLLRQKELNAQADSILSQQQLLQNTIDQLGKDVFSMKHTVILKEMPTQYVASLRSVIPTYEQEGILWEQLHKELASQNIRYANPCNASAVFFDEGFKECDVDVEIRISVQGTHTDTERIRFQTIDPILVASVTYQGSYGDHMSSVCQSTADWIDSNNSYEMEGAMFVIYLVGPATESNADKWVTEVCFPVKEVR